MLFPEDVHPDEEILSEGDDDFEDEIDTEVSYDYPDDTEYMVSQYVD